MKLRIGKMTTQDLIKWFDVSYSAFRKRATEFYEELNTYCDYEKKHGFVLITKIKIEEYNKNLKSNIDKIYYKEIVDCINNHNGLSTLSGMARKYDSIDGVTRDSLRKSRDLLFGSDKNLPVDGSQFFYKTRGLIGEREYCWGIKLNDKNIYRELTKSEYEIFSSLLAKHGTPEEMLKLKTIDKMFKDNVITKEEYFILKEQYGFFGEVIKTFKDLTGYQIVHCTKHEIVNNLDLTEAEKSIIKAIKED